MQNIRTVRHCIFALHAHLVSVTNYRHRIFSDAHLKRMEEIMRAVCTDFECELIERSAIRGPSRAWRSARRRRRRLCRAAGRCTDGCARAH
ncbi:transposase [Streptomyces sp. NBC_01618]|nr:transposase [Streptomyces sp. NBC_01618]